MGDKAIHRPFDLSPVHSLNVYDRLEKEKRTRTRRTTHYSGFSPRVAFGAGMLKPSHRRSLTCHTKNTNPKISFPVTNTGLIHGIHNWSTQDNRRLSWLAGTHTWDLSAHLFRQHRLQLKSVAFLGLDFTVKTSNDKLCVCYSTESGGGS